MIEQGAAAIWFGFATEEYSATATVAPAVAPLPLGGSALAPEDYLASGMFISKNTQHPEACWQWLRFLSRSSAGGETPARISMRPREQNEATAAAYAALDRGTGENGLSWQDGDTNLFWFFRAIDRTLQGNDLERELADAQFLTEQYLACVRGGEAANTCATTVDPTYDGL